MEMRPRGVARVPVARTLAVVDRELYIRTISTVVDYFEGYDTLALILNVKVDELRRWADGRSRPPTEIFLRIVDLARRPSGTLRSVN